MPEETPVFITKSETLKLHGIEYVVGEMSIENIPEVVSECVELLNIIPIDEWQGLNGPALAVKILKTRELYSVIQRVLIKLSGIEELGNMGVIALLKVASAVIRVNDLTEARDQFFELKSLMEAMR